MEDKHSRAIELAKKYVLSAENKLISENQNNQITVGDLIEISKKGLETMTSINDESIDSEELQRLKKLDNLEKLLEEHSGDRGLLFGTKKTSCALLLFQNSLAK